MTIWMAKDKPEILLKALNEAARPTIHTPLGIQYTRLGPNYLEGSMPVNEQTHQPMGLLHGGASVVLAESLGSLASYLVIGEDPMRACVGIEINATHLRSMTSGSVTGRATPIRLGKVLHVWKIEIRDTQTSHDDPRLVSVARLTVMVRTQKS